LPYEEEEELPSPPVEESIGRVIRRPEEYEEDPDPGPRDEFGFYILPSVLVRRGMPPQEREAALAAYREEASGPLVGCGSASNEQPSIEAQGDKKRPPGLIIGGQGLLYEDGAATPPLSPAQRIKQHREVLDEGDIAEAIAEVTEADITPPALEDMMQMGFARSDAAMSLERTCRHGDPNPNPDPNSNPNPDWRTNGDRNAAVKYLMQQIRERKKLEKEANVRIEAWLSSEMPGDEGGRDEDLALGATLLREGVPAERRGDAWLRILMLKGHDSVPPPSSSSPMDNNNNNRDSGERNQDQDSRSSNNNRDSYADILESFDTKLSSGGDSDAVEEANRKAEEAKALVMKQKQEISSMVAGPEMMAAVVALAEMEADAEHKVELAHHAANAVERCELDPILDTIEKDLHRTFPDCTEFTPETLKALRRVLLAYAARNPTVGYCQGMNFVAAMMLLVFGLEREEDAFRSFCVLIDVVFPDYFATDLIGSISDQAVLQELVFQELPSMAAHIDTVPGGFISITIQWFCSLMIGWLPTRTLLRVWDSCIAEGRGFLHKASLAIFCRAEEEMPTAVEGPDALESIMLAMRRAALLAYDTNSFISEAQLWSKYDSVEVIERAKGHRLRYHKENEGLVAGRVNILMKNKLAAQSCKSGLFSEGGVKLMMDNGWEAAVPAEQGSLEQREKEAEGDEDGGEDATSISLDQGVGDEDWAVKRDSTGLPSNILVLAPGTTGARLLLPFASFLSLQGHQVRLVMHRGLPRSLSGALEVSRKCGVEIYPASVEEADDEASLLLIDKRENNLAWCTRGAEKGVGTDDGPRLTRSLLESQYLASEGFETGAIISWSGAIGHVHLSQGLKVPLHLFSESITKATHALPHPWVEITVPEHDAGIEEHTSPSWNRLSYQVIEALEWGRLETEVNAFRWGRLRLPNIQARDLSTALLKVPITQVWSPNFKLNKQIESRSSGLTIVSPMSIQADSMRDVSEFPENMAHIEVENPSSLEELFL